MDFKVKDKVMRIFGVGSTRTIISGEIVSFFEDREGERYVEVQTMEGVLHNFKIKDIEMVEPYVRETIIRDVSPIPKPLDINAPIEFPKAVSIEPTAPDHRNPAMVRFTPVEAQTIKMKLNEISALLDEIIQRGEQ